MGCLAQLFIQFTVGLVWYVIINPLMTLFFILKDIGLIWSVGFYVLSEFLFLDTFIQDYRTAITILLLIPFILKLFAFALRSLNRYLIWSGNRAEKKQMKLKRKENEVNRFYD